MSAKRHAAAVLEQRRRGHRLDARQTFEYLRPLLLDSRPVTVIHVPARYRELMPSEIRAGRPTTTASGKPARVKVPAHEIRTFGKPTFRNVINKAGEHV